jgi:FkbM family methyltransferase
MNFHDALSKCYFSMMPILSRPYAILHTFRKVVAKGPTCDLPVESLLTRGLRPDDVVLEAGTNMGGLTRLLSDMVKEVHTFDPNPKALEYARKYLHGRTNVRFYCAAVGGKTGTAIYNYVSRFHGGNSLCQTYDYGGRIRFLRQFNVPETTIQRFAEKTGVRLTALVLDCEGSELSALVGAGEFLPDRVFTETHSVKRKDGTTRSTLPECRAFLEAHGFEVTIFYDKDRYPWIRGVRK